MLRGSAILIEEEMMIEFVINFAPITKKNSQQIFKKKLKNGKTVRFITPSERFKDYQRHCAFVMPETEKAINTPVNIKAMYYMPTKRRVDITNLNAALHDVLVHYQIIEDDNCAIVASTDGSRVAYDKKQPRTEVYITESDYVCWKNKKDIGVLIPEKKKKKLRKVLY